MIVVLVLFLTATALYIGGNYDSDSNNSTYIGTTDPGLGEEGFAGVICAKPTSAFVSFKDASHDLIIGIRGEYGTSGSLNDWSNFVFGRTCAANVSLSSETTVRAGRTFAAQTPHTFLPGVLSTLLLPIIKAITPLTHR